MRSPMIRVECPEGDMTFQYDTYSYSYLVQAMREHYRKAHGKALEWTVLQFVANLKEVWI